MSKLLHSSSPDVLELLDALGLKDKYVSSFTLKMSVGAVAELEVEYVHLVYSRDISAITREMIESGSHTIHDATKLTKYLKKYELHEIPSDT